MNRYVKKPIAIEAVKWKGFNNDEIKDFAGDNVKIEVIREGDADRGILDTTVAKSPSSSSISSYILCISLLRITVLSLIYISSQRRRRRRRS